MLRMFQLRTSQYLTLKPRQNLDMLPAAYNTGCRGFRQCLIRLLLSFFKSQSLIVFPFHSTPCSYSVDYKQQPV